MKLSEFLKEVNCRETDLSKFHTEEEITAVKQDGHALKFVKKQTPKIYMAAIKQNGYTLQYVKKQTPEICLAAVKQNQETIQLVDRSIFEKEDL